MIKLFLILKTITILKIWNAFILQFSYILSLLSKSPILLGSPLSLSIEPTNFCNLKCPECPSGLRTLERDKGSIDFKNVKKIIDEIGSKLFSILFYFQGEPFLNKNLLQFISYANDKNIYTLTSTNGHFINNQNAIDIVNSGLSELIVSVDGTTQEIYEKYRKEGNLSCVFESIKEIANAKQKLGKLNPILTIQFLVTSENEHQIAEIKKIYKSLGANNLSLKSAQIYDFENGNHLIPSNQKYARYKKTANSKFEIKSALKNKCSRLWYTSVICCDGTVVPCCFDKNSTYPLGNISEYQFIDIWNSNEYKNFRNRILQSRKSIPICCNCTEGLKML